MSKQAKVSDDTVAANSNDAVTQMVPRWGINPCSSSTKLSDLQPELTPLEL
jgi:hypothetical protein